MRGVGEFWVKVGAKTAAETADFVRGFLVFLKMGAL
jgi:hypothetical protein